MFTRYVLIGALAAVLFVASDAAAQAPFTFNVPVSVHNVHPDVDAIKVMCRISSGVPSLSNEVGIGATDVSMRGRTNYTGTVRVEVNMKPGKSPWDALKYTCTLYYTTPVQPGTLGFSTSENAPPHGRADPSRPFVQIVSGDL